MENLQNRVKPDICWQDSPKSESGKRFRNLIPALFSVTGTSRIAFAVFRQNRLAHFGGGDVLAGKRMRPFALPKALNFVTPQQCIDRANVPPTVVKKNPDWAAESIDDTSTLPTITSINPDSTSTTGTPTTLSRCPRANTFQRCEPCKRYYWHSLITICAKARP
jgi:hypothetical protein